ncbi:MAG: hypothetical protein DYG94_03040 [Leptolyngbya sp. PLA3]|nr:MAG: hypothetical protein EDM82_11260 [Cyanobacteria bacterium CYA]MCE7967705.1 hypothetical protein [Leptolyngbya sp. PL-A3]
MHAAPVLPEIAPFIAAQVAAVALLPALLASRVDAQFFGDVHVSYEWHAAQLGQTISNADASVLCAIPWLSDRAAQGESLLLDETLNADNGGCTSVVLRRGANYSGIAAASGASLFASSSIGAVADFGLDQHGRAFGAMTHRQTLQFRVLSWVRGDLLVRFIADQALDNALSYLDGRFRGPVDPLSGDGVLMDIAWAGSSRLVENRPDTILAPGVYELNVDGSGEFLDLVLRYFNARTLGAVDVTSPQAASPAPELDLDQDGWVGLSDACLWPENRTDANQDGQTNQSDLELILALARAGGEDATDADADGIPEQCVCPGDWNGDGNVNFFDVQSYLSEFAAHLPSADLNGDGAHNFFDIQNFLNMFSAGC